jgi:hypothetical protein
VYLLCNNLLILGKQKKKVIGRTHEIRNPLLDNVGKYFTCSTERRKARREGSDTA